MYKILLSSIAKIITVASPFGLIAGYCGGWMFGIGAFFCVVAIQFLIHHYMLMSVESRNETNEMLAEQALKEISERKLPYRLNCAYCSESNMAAISFTEENIFECNKCKQLNKVFIQFTTSRVTSPLSLRIPDDVIELGEDNEPDIGVHQDSANEPIKLNDPAVNIAPTTL